MVTGRKQAKSWATDMAVSAARTAAFDILLRVERESCYATELLHSAHYRRFSTSDHALATELVMGVLRWRSRLDEQIATASAQPLSKLDLEVLIALRLALYQLGWLDRIPPRAALHESVELVKGARKRSAAPFVNAVLRKLAATALHSPKPSGQTDLYTSADDLARAFAHPLWLVERWADQYGLNAARQICGHNQTVPSTSIRLSVPGAEAELRMAEIDLTPGSLLSSARRVRTGDITRTIVFRKGQVAIQDEASQLIAALVSSEGKGRGRDAARILDCCAAPGGKTLAIADRNPGALVAAVDLHPHRARLLQELTRTTGSGRIRIIAADACQLPFSVPFDRVLADVPCSGTGTLARNPEIKWKLSPGDLRDLQSRQRAILDSALAQVAAGGRLIYSTCSLEKEENEDTVEQAVVSNRSFRVLDCRSELERLKKSGDLTWPDPTSLTCGPYLRTIPGIHPCDGFFAAILERS